MPQKILCVSYDDRLLRARRMLLEQRGYCITAALGLKESLSLCGEGGFALFILGHSIPYPDKLKLIERFRQACTAPILSLWRVNEAIVDTVNYIEFSDDPAELVRAVGAILARESTASAGAA